MSDDIQSHLSELNRLLGEKYPPLSGKLKLLRVADDPKMIDVVGNEAGLVQWSMALATSVIFKHQTKPDLPGALFIHDHQWLTEDTDLQVRLYSCDIEIHAKQLAYDAMEKERTETWKDRMRDGIGVTVGCGGGLFVLYCIISTVVGWFR